MKKILTLPFFTRSFSVVVLLLVVSTSSMARQSGHGRVNMSGSIIDTPCAISTSDLEQTIDFGTVTTGEIIHDGRGGERRFSLNLINCDLHPFNESKPDWSVFETTFDGPSENGFFSVSGAKGIGLQIIDSTGSSAIPGKALPGGNLVAGSQRLDYVIQLVSDHHNLKPGLYHSTVRFKIDYF